MFRNFARDYSGVKLVSLVSKEDSIRRSWQMSLIAYASTLLGVSVFALLVPRHVIGFTGWQQFVALLSAIYGAFINVMAPCIFAYRGKGTAWLKFMLILLLPAQATQFVGSILETYPTLSLPEVLLMIGVMLVMLIYWISCWRLHKINVQYKRYKNLTTIS